MKNYIIPYHCIFEIYNKIFILGPVGREDFHPPSPRSPLEGKLINGNMIKNEKELNFYTNFYLNNFIFFTFFVYCSRVSLKEIHNEFAFDIGIKKQWPALEELQVTLLSLF